MGNAQGKSKHGANGAESRARRSRDGRGHGRESSRSNESGFARDDAIDDARGSDALSYGPQTPTVPMAGEDGARGGFPDWATTEPALVPVAINWTQGGNSVEVEGSFDNWQSRQTLHKSGNREFAIVMSLRPGVYQYKFIVDGQWKYAPDQPTMYDEMGNVNNVLEVQEYVPEILDSLDAFTAPASPPASYDCSPFHSDDFSKDPPPIPPQLNMTLLNVPMVPDAPNLLPRPQHVVLNHTYCDGTKADSGVQVLGTTHRYRSKYITVVYLKSMPPQ
ncbi:hypothetical protein BE221DRAFT_23258 [Ostreococcus tauri]|uniref:Association with the SNF1 complex (ASC) domain-containing protein n=1 Tax=Ostreococcus tauri TaxID=70448 RepID=A0A1Y5IA67_OSTTA|nr:hypothetical protein BE221DRAFT_23258 [Ostreococcus tauri]